jgi:16S rRNA (adenine1518-N6/adenine1519-N6)-dimethyltransferase
VSAEPGDAAPPRPPWSEFKDALETAGFRPSRRLGQNFLLDENMARAIARDAEVGAGDVVVEIGPGCGFLSVHLAHSGTQLIACEIDERLFGIAGRFLAPYPNVKLLLADALASKHELAPELDALLPETSDWHVVSNLPYSISGPFLAILAQRAAPPRSITVLVQLEVGERLAALPATGEWGPLSIAVQSAYAVRLVRTVGPDLFWPRPRVSSAVMRLELRAGLAPVEDRQRRLTLIRALFLHRRQSLGRVLRGQLGAEAAQATLAELGLNPKERAETLGRDLLDALGDAPAWRETFAAR